ncbi:NADPH:quinone reductase-like Zn-dependent oxidoreductase [Actinoplanes tereljensis]|uniref:NADPH:quinone reductase n=1 Tax=Paractinoplanes tereljensis TaxID=571912 RepID=A0A919TUJ5_9ACTN|nr:NAD(P)-dependent alcohol dehydrogenase [Actinoplanes tereljensis]GIF22384.1 NADPH:quinone reductase [Actinoplanes tereljensis]
MKAIVQDVYGDADVLRLADVPPPTPGPKDVLIRVRAAGVDRGAWHAMTGLPLIARLGFGPRRPRNPTPGMDLAGVVEAVGAEVTDFTPGDEVFGSGRSTWAEYALARPGKLARKPAHLTFEQAAALPTSGSTARRMVGEAAAGTETLIIGAGGGVGSFAVLLATARGDRVTGVCSTAKADAVRSLGADRVIDYTREPVTGRYDLVVDIAGNRSLAELRALLTPRGRLMIAGGEDGGRWFGGLERNLQLFALSPFVRQHLGAPVVLTNRPALEALTSLTPLVSETYPLAEAPAAMARLASGRIAGKAVLIS